MFGFDKKRKTRAENLQQIIDRTADKCAGEMAQALSLDDPAARYLALAELQQRRAADIKALDGELEKKRSNRNLYTALGIMAPIAIGVSCLHPVSFAAMALMKVAANGVVMLAPAGPISDSLNKSGYGRKRLQKKMAPLYAPLRHAQTRAADEMKVIETTRIAALATSPLATKITALNPALKDAMLDSFRAAAARVPEQPEAPQAPAPAPRVFKL